jgi:hypothetical protein
MCGRSAKRTRVHGRPRPALTTLLLGSGFMYGMPPCGRELLMAETAIQFLERWRQAHVYAEQRTLEQLDETVAECMGAAGEDDISTDDLEKSGRW